MTDVVDLAKARFERAWVDQATDLILQEQDARVKRLMAVLEEPFELPCCEERTNDYCLPIYFYISSLALLKRFRRFATLYEEQPKQLAADLRTLASLLDELGNRNLPFSERTRLVRGILARVDGD